jgi:hypothetical protein
MVKGVQLSAPACIFMVDYLSMGVTLLYVTKHTDFVFNISLRWKLQLQQ